MTDPYGKPILEGAARVRGLGLMGFMACRRKNSQA